jgi:hypothetical protein
MQVETRAACAYCQDTVEDAETSACSDCQTVYHEDCWQENGGCAVLGCASGPDAATPQQLFVDASAPTASLPPQAGSTAPFAPRAMSPGFTAQHPVASPVPVSVPRHMAPRALPMAAPPPPPQPPAAVASPASAQQAPMPQAQARRGRKKTVLTVLAMVVALSGVGAIAYQQGHNVGSEQGFDRGFARGQDRGFDRGWDVGYDHGNTDGWDTGYDVGWDDGWSSGYDSGVSCGVTTYYEWNC